VFKYLNIIILISGISLAQAIPIPNIEYSPKQYVCYKAASEQIVVDGKLNETSWEKAEWTDDFIDIEGSVKPNPRFKTKVKMLWENKYFYIAAELTEPHIWANLLNRDDIIFFDNDFEVFIDPDGDTHGYVEFEMNALNTVWDLLLIQPYRDIDNAALHGWDIKNLESGVEILGTLNNSSDIDDKWTVEIAFPWKGFDEITNMKTPPINGDQWRVNFSRVEWHTEVIDGKYSKITNPETGKSLPEDNWVWSPQGVVNMHYPEMWGLVQFSTTEVGDSVVKFQKNIEEDIKWYLRNVYYLQKEYFAENHKYADDIKKLGIKNMDIKGYKFPVVIETTSSYFEAKLYSDSGKIYYKISANGLVQKIE